MAIARFYDVECSHEHDGERFLLFLLILGPVLLNDAAIETIFDDEIVEVAKDSGGLGANPKHRGQRRFALPIGRRILVCRWGRSGGHVFSTLVGLAPGCQQYLTAAMARSGPREDSTQRARG